MTDSDHNSILWLSQGKYAIVDNDDCQLLYKYIWHYTARGYARASRLKNAFLHRVIMNPPEGLHVDHINGNMLDNRKSNLRLCTIAQNRMNQRKNFKNMFKGISWNKKDKRWRARVKLGGKHINQGSFKTPIEAARAYDKGAIELFGEFACTNEMLGLYDKPFTNPQLKGLIT